jgi:hypothetical protein
LSFTFSSWGFDAQFPSEWLIPSLVLKTLPHIWQVNLFDVGLSIGGSEEGF